MANRWLRGVKPYYGQGDSSNSYINEVVEHSLFVYYFLRRMLGFTLIQEYVNSVYNPSAGQKSFEYHHNTRTGTDGVFSGSDLNFTSASNPFVAGDVNKFICVVDGTNDVNCGIYQIKTYNSAGSVAIDFLVPVGTYPTAATGLTWYVIDGSTLAPTSANDWAVLQSPHDTYPFQVKIRLVDSSVTTPIGTGMKYSPEGSAWDTSAHNWTTGKAVITQEYKVVRGNYTYQHGKVYAYGNTDGSFFAFFPWINNATGYKHFHCASILTPFETSPTRTARERFGVFGTKLLSVDSGNADRGIANDYSMGQGQVFSELGFTTVNANWMDYRDGNSQSFLRRSMSTNHRSSKREGLPIWILGDPANANFLSAPWGYMNSSYISIGTVQSISEMTGFDSNNRIHFRDDIVLPWPGVTPV